ncbi:DUF2399 domain-containing protein, partial [Patulibacter sp. NPDC049589]|uniref:DUF2399 domain-containing protein n=1 Tax=Patulibacter sp. NPDC049589 TaxID=3154731 RepID=UPI00341CE023
ALRHHPQSQSRDRQVEPVEASTVGPLQVTTPKGRPFAELFPDRPRQLRIKGPLEHPQAALWADSVDEVSLRVLEHARGVICVENHETFEHLLRHTQAGWILLQVPGGPPPAEARLLNRVVSLAPGLSVLAAFDPDPAGIKIAVNLAERADVRLDARLMTPEALLAAAPLRLADWDRRWLERLAGHAGALEPLREAIAAHDRKGEQESLHTWLDAVLDIF